MLKYILIFIVLIMSSGCLIDDSVGQQSSNMPIGAHNISDKGNDADETD